MSTNYYLQKKITPEKQKVLLEYHLGRHRLFIGKSSAGWTFAFKAHSNREDDNYQQIMLDLEDFGSIDSYKKYKEVWSMPEYEIVDEYSKFIGKEAMCEIVEERLKNPERKLENHIIEYPEDGFIDPEGHGFSRRAFS